MLSAMLRRVFLVLALATAATALAGCGDTLSFDPVAKAADQTAKYESARVEFWATMSIEGLGGMSFNGNGIFDGRSRSGALNMRFKLPGEARAQLGGIDPTMQMIMDGRDGLIMYMRSPFFGALAGDKWLKLDLEKVAKQEGVDLNGLMNASQADPTRSLKMLTGSNDARVLGYDRVRGVFTTHYTLTIDGDRVDELKQLGADSIPAEAWIDDQGRVRRLKVDMSLNTAVGGAFTMSMTEELYAFGVKVDVRPPHPSQVLDAASVLGR